MCGTLAESMLTRAASVPLPQRQIMEVIGRPSSEDVESVQSPFASTMLDSRHESRRKGLSELLPAATSEALDLLRRLLQFNPRKRLSAEEAPRHPYVAQFDNSADEPACDRVIPIPIDDNTKYSISEYRNKLYGEIVKRKKELRRRMREKEAARAAGGGHRSHHSSGGSRGGSHHSNSHGHRSSSHGHRSSSHSHGCGGSAYGTGSGGAYGAYRS